MNDKKRLIKLVEDAIANGATTIEDIHKAIARLPLKVLEEIDSLSDPVKQVGRVQDRAIGAIYDLIRDINERVAKYATALLAKAYPTKAAARPAPARKRPAAAAKRRSAPKRPIAKKAVKRTARKR